jgi:hypothetical protein
MKRYAAFIAPLSIRILTIGMSDDVDVPRTALVFRSTCQMRNARSASRRKNVESVAAIQTLALHRMILTGGDGVGTKTQSKDCCHPALLFLHSGLGVMGENPHDIRS